MARNIGLASVKINGIYRVDVKSFRFDVSRSVNQNVTQGGVSEGIGVWLVSGSFEEIIPLQGQYDWSSLVDFAMQAYDYETNKILIVSAQGCNAERIGVSTDNASANTSKAISWKGTLASKF